MLLILTSNHTDDINLLAKTAEALGWETYTSPGSWRLPQEIIGKEGAVYGGLYFCETIAEQMNWSLKSNELDWLTKLPEEYVKRKITFTTLAEAKKITERKFFKSADGRIFTPMVYDSGNELPQNSAMNNALILISDVVKFVSEYRCFVKNREVVSISCYRHYTSINEHYNWYLMTDSVIDFVNKMLKDSKVPCVGGAVIDVGRFKDGEIAVIGSKPAYASERLYGCEVVAALDTIKDSVL